MTETKKSLNQIDGKTYRNIGNFIMDYISLGYLEEVKENKEPTDKCDLEGKTVHGTDIDVATSILEKLREWVDGLPHHDRKNKGQYQIPKQVVTLSDVWN